jgi:hypothetical protein
MSAGEKTVEVSRRNLLRNATALTGGAAIFATALIAEKAKAANKMSKEIAGYQTIPGNGAQCDICALFQPPISCAMVEGNIDLRGWCRFFTPRI